ncbi:Rv3654c family TadE-like protein [Arthrobacter woluwensis]|uniref:Helicase/secretion neighborhood TadE-like protein n=1 Tax=Arthrobacter woluwensis TaxID=156980 RepID=A0A1H4LDI7_9MICC|nr:Rv3654c family TadE-like protein [Arthrobacter woluwensis]SEB68262.1 helicase/secretion neighborhood TadE-like protein [Arthrobacter woluwensis]
MTRCASASRKSHSTARGPCRRNEPERGSGTVLSLGLGLVLVTAVLLVVLLGQAATLASRAAAAADLSALAAADAARGLRNGDPCTVAAEIAARDGARLDSCELQGPSGDIAEVRASVGGAFGLGRGEGRARAGPPP